MKLSFALEILLRPKTVLGKRKSLRGVESLVLVATRFFESLALKMLLRPKALAQNRTWRMMNTGSDNSKLA
jgi:hypothetical protein